jgi:hypothetical protein
MRLRYANAWTFEQMLAVAQKNIELWKAVRARAVVDDATVARAGALGGAWHLLALSEDWCGDAVNILPVFDELAHRAPNFDLRIVSRDANPDLMDAHLTNGTRRSIPVVIAYDEQFIERAWWGPRPAPLQRWVLNEGKTLDKDARYKEIRRWYAIDKGRTALDELLSAIERGVQSATASTSAA